MYLIILAKERARTFRYAVKHLQIVDLLIGRQAVKLNPIKFLLPPNQLQHSIQEVMTWEEVKRLLRVPLLLAHVQAALLTIVSL